LKENTKTIKELTDGVQQLKEALAFSEQNRKDLEAYIRLKKHGLPKDKVKRRMRVELRGDES
jgi:vacuolar-type H+-ATPase subunit C/Vma6